MSVTIGPAITLQQDRLSFPGMQPREILIWKNWLKQFETQFDSFDYNVHIGAGTDPGPNWPEYVRKAAVAVSQLRLDAVAYKNGIPTLVEVKDRAGASAVGQLLTYEAVWIEDHPGLPGPPLILVTNRLQVNIMPLVRKANIRLDVIPTDFTPLALAYKAYLPRT